MKGKRYRILVNDDPTGVHSWMSREIEEVFVPELGLFINKEAVFLGEESSRVPGEYEEIRVDASGCMALRDSLAMVEQLKERLGESLFGED